MLLVVVMKTDWKLHCQKVGCAGKISLVMYELALHLTLTFDPAVAQLLMYIISPDV